MSPAVKMFELGMVTPVGVPRSVTTPPLPILSSFGEAFPVGLTA